MAMMIAANVAQAVLHWEAEVVPGLDVAPADPEVTRYRRGWAQAPHPLVAWGSRSKQDNQYQLVSLEFAHMYKTILP